MIFLFLFSGWKIIDILVHVNYGDLREGAAGGKGFPGGRTALSRSGATGPVPLDRMLAAGGRHSCRPTCPASPGLAVRCAILSCSFHNKNSCDMIPETGGSGEAAPHVVICR